MDDNAPRGSLCDLTRAELATWCKAHGQPAYRAVQVRRWLFGKQADSFEAMHDLPEPFRAELRRHFDFFSTTIAGHHIASDRTEKLLLELADGHHVECVLMREPGRQTVCVSTQVGCGMGCVFCASGLGGLQRNLTAGEILEQVLRLCRLLGSGERITNVVVMGIGEPLANLKALLPALESLGEREGLGLGSRRITISTVGSPEKIRELSRCGKPYNLAVSLHAPNDQLRSELVPVNERIGLAEVLAAAEEYFQRTGRRVTYEYVLLAGINDEPRHAHELARLLLEGTAHVNLIPLNAVGDLPFRAPTNSSTRRFAEILERAGIAATVRKRKGADIDAACGQLRHRRQRMAAIP